MERMVPGHLSVRGAATRSRRRQGQRRAARPRGLFSRLRSGCDAGDGCQATVEVLAETAVTW